MFSSWLWIQFRDSAGLSDRTFSGSSLAGREPTAKWSIAENI